MSEHAEDEFNDDKSQIQGDADRERFAEVLRRVAVGGARGVIVGHGLATATLAARALLRISVASFKT